MEELNLQKLVPLERPPASIFGFMAGILEIKGDIIQPIDELWDLESKKAVLGKHAFI